MLMILQGDEAIYRDGVNGVNSDGYSTVASLMIIPMFMLSCGTDNQIPSFFLAQHLHKREGVSLHS
jgi:hypothetical protein